MGECRSDSEYVPGKNINRTSSTGKFEISSTVKKTYKVLVYGGTETFITRIKIHKTILAGCKVKEETVAARSLIPEIGQDIVSLTVADQAANQDNIDNLEESNCELDETVCPLKKMHLTTLNSFFHQPRP